MRVTNAVSHYDAYARLNASYPLGATRVPAVEPLSPRYPDHPPQTARLPVERFVEGEVLRATPADPTERLRAQRIYTVEVQANTPEAPVPPSHPAVAAYRQTVQADAPLTLGHFLDRYA
jgi:hypothetical protein